MSQPPYPPPGGSDAGDDRPAGRPYPEWQAAEGSTVPVQQPPYDGAPRYDQPQYGQAPYGQPQYGQAPYGQALYGQALYGQAPYGQAPYGQAPYGQAPYGPPQDQAGAPTPPWGQGAASPGTGSRLAIVLAALAALVIAGLAVALFVWSGSDDDDDDGASGGDSAMPTAASEPEGLGGDAELDEYAEDCHDGDMQACDDLYRESPSDSAYELYGGTCAGRQPNADASVVFCVDAFPPAS